MTSSLLAMLRDRKVITARKVSEADIALALASIRYIVAPLGENSQASQWVSLRKYHLFPRLKALIVMPPIRQERAILSSLGLMDSREAPPMEASGPATQNRSQGRLFPGEHCIRGLGILDEGVPTTRPPRRRLSIPLSLGYADGERKYLRVWGLVKMYVLRCKCWSEGRILVATTETKEKARERRLLRAKEPAIVCDIKEKWHCT